MASGTLPSGGISLDQVYPVGSIYMSVNNTDPGTLFGGTWTQIQDTFLLSAGSTYTAGDTGGAATHTHTTGNHTLTVNEMPSHTHTTHTYYGSQGNSYIAGCGSSTSGHTGGNTGNNYTGGGQAHNHGNTGDSSNMPPYLVVYMWQRTA